MFLRSKQMSVGLDVGSSSVKVVRLAHSGGPAKLLGLAIAVARQLLETKIRYARTIERGHGIPVLSTVPELRRLRRLGARGSTS